MNNNLLIVSVNSLFHLFMAIYYYRKDGFAIRAFIWAYLFVFSVGSVFLLWSGKYFDVMEFPHFSQTKRIDIIPYVLNALFTFVLIFPLGEISRLKIQKSLNYKNASTQIVDLFFIIEIIYTILKFSQLFIVIQYGFGNFHDLGKEVQDVLLYGGVPFLQYVNYMGKFCNIVMFPYILAHQFIGFDKHVVSLTKLNRLFIVFSLNSVLSGLVGGSRAGVFFGAMNVMLFIVIFRKEISKKYRFNIKSIIIVFSILYLGFLFFSSIASERFDDKMAANDNLLRYLGESYLNLGFEFWDNVTTHTYGLVSFGDFANISSEQLRFITGTNIHWFETAYGSLYVDFGDYIPLIIALIFSIIFYQYVKSPVLRLNQFAIIMYYYSVCYGLPFGFSIAPFDLLIIVCMIIIPKILDIYFTESKSLNKKIKLYAKTNRLWRNNSQLQHS